MRLSQHLSVSAAERGHTSASLSVGSTLESTVEFLWQTIHHTAGYEHTPLTQRGQSLQRWKLFERKLSLGHYQAADTEGVQYNVRLQVVCPSISSLNKEVKSAQHAC